MTSDELYPASPSGDRADHPGDSTAEAIPPLDAHATAAETDADEGEPLGMQEASVQLLLEEETTSLVERVEQGQDPSALAVDGYGAEPLAIATLEARIAALQEQEQALQQSIASLQAAQIRAQAEAVEAQAAMGRLVQEGLRELEQRKQTLQISVEQLERRQERIRNEMRTTFAGVSQDLAIRVKSFKDYLVGSLQDLVVTAEQ